MDLHQETNVFEIDETQEGQYLYLMVCGMETIKPIEHRIENNLTPRQLEIFTLYGKRKKYTEIAQLLVISEKTVVNHMSDIIERLAFKGSHEFYFNAIWWVSLKKHEK